MGFDFDAISNKFNRKIDRFLDSLSNNPSALGIAVSGGSDSLGLLYLINSWPNKRNLKMARKVKNQKQSKEKRPKEES